MQLHTKQWQRLCVFINPKGKLDVKKDKHTAHQLTQKKVASADPAQTSQVL